MEQVPAFFPPYSVPKYRFTIIVITAKHHRNACFTPQMIALIQAPITFLHSHRAFHPSMVGRSMLLSYYYYSHPIDRIAHIHDHITIMAKEFTTTTIIDLLHLWMVAVRPASLSHTYIHSSPFIGNGGWGGGRHHCRIHIVLSGKHCHGKGACAQ